MKAYSLKITLPKFAYFINLEILPVTSKIRTTRPETHPEESELMYRRLRANEQVRQELDRIQTIYTTQFRF